MRASSSDGPPESAVVLEAFDRDVLLSTGRSIRVRPSRPADAVAMRRFYDDLSDRATYFRFFGLRPAMLDERLNPSGGQEIGHRVVLIALDADAVVAIGEYIRVPDRAEAEVAFAVADNHQHEGIGTLLLEDLALIAVRAGMTKLVAETLAGNGAMLLVFRSVGLVMRSWYDEGQVHVELDLTEESLLEERSDGRDWAAAVASLAPILSPRHVVVIGAGRGPSPGRSILDNLVGAFRGRVSVVHPSAVRIGGVEPVAHVSELDAVPDLAVIAVPAASVVEVVADCGRAGVRAAVVVSAGFAEQEGIEGVERERALLATARRFGMRVVGPNCLGVVSTAAGLNATFLRRVPRTGSLAVASQSGGVGVVIADEASRRELGISDFVSLGNKIDVSGNDLLRYWADDPHTRVVLMYLESIGDPRRFARIARTVSRRMPLVALKAGRSTAGQRGARSHTAALATDDARVDALFAHTGVIRADTLDQLLDVGALLIAQPAPTGRRVALIGNAGGPLILAADAASANGLEVVELSVELGGRLRALVPDAASVSNPVDLLATVTSKQLLRVLDEVAGSGEVDACVVVSVNLAGEEAAPLRLDWSHPLVPAAAVVFAGASGAGSMPRYPTPERAVEAVALAADRGAWLASAADDRVTTTAADLLALRRRARLALDQMAGHEWLGLDQTMTLLGELGLPVAPWAAAASAAGCAREAGRIGFPCVLKADVAGVVHTSQEGTVVVDVQSAAAVRRTVGDFQQRFGRRLQRVLIQRQVPPGVELLVGGVRDPAIGPLVVVAAGGTDAEVLDDRSVALAPVTALQARRAVEQLRMFPLLQGAHGRPTVPIKPIIHVVERIGLLMATVPEITELDLNPVIAGPDSCIIVDARIAVAPPILRPLRQLRQPAGDPVCPPGGSDQARIRSHGGGSAADPRGR